MKIILDSFLFFLPAGIANMMPVLAAKIPVLNNLNYPLDFGKKINGKRIFGDHKTIRGVIFGVAAGIFTALILNKLSPEVYANTKPLLLGFLLSFGALIGDSVKSFLKRQVGIVPGKSWFPFDQIDYIFGGLLFSWLIIKLPLLDYIIIFFIYFVLHLLINATGFLTGFKKSII